MCSANPHLLRLGLIQSLRASSQFSFARRPSIYNATVLGSCVIMKPSGPEIGVQRCNLRHSLLPIAAAMDEDLGDASFYLDDDDGVFGGCSDYIISSSEGEDSDIDDFLSPFAETDLPLGKERLETPDAALTLTAHRLANIQKGYRNNRTRRGVILTLGLIAFLALFLFFIDWWSWRIVRLPLESFYLTFPFAVSAFLSACIGCLFVPIADGLKIHQVIRREGSVSSSRKAIPTIGGLYFIPVGITTVRAIVGHNSIHVNGAAAAALCLAAIGLLDDIYLFAKNFKYRLPGWIKLLLHLAAGTWFSIWLESTDLPTPYSMYTSSLTCEQQFFPDRRVKSYIACQCNQEAIEHSSSKNNSQDIINMFQFAFAIKPDDSFFIKRIKQSHLQRYPFMVRVLYQRKLLVPLPPPYGLVHLGKYYQLLTVFCFIAMPNGVHVTDGADGLVGGVSALAFIGMSIAVLPICPELAVFGASMAGASVGFLLHNRYKASLLMGDVGSLGLGGALTAMAACTGMFLPLLIASGVFILEALSVGLQVIVLKATVRRKLVARLVSRVSPLHQQLKLYGLKVPLIVASAYIVSSILAMFAGYVGLVSA